MLKLTLVLLGLFWLSCGNTAETAQNKTIASEKNVESVPKISTDSMISKTSEKEEVVVNTQQDTIRPVEKELVIVPEEQASIPLTSVKKKPVTEHNAIPPSAHLKWNNLLAKHVDNKGNVNYKRFLNDAAVLDEYLSYLAENSPKKDWLKNEKLAYYINLYNAATVKLILENYPTESIKDIKNPWGKNWVKTGDGILSLGDIEHKVLRKMNEPRIHFAINCASYSCPKLLNQAFTAEQMERQLHSVTLDFINDVSRNSISREKMLLSNIFKWYKKDFTENGSLADYIKPYTKVKIDTNTDIDYLKYDWNLNEAK